MKHRSNHFYPLSLALASIPLLSMPARAVEQAPDQTQEQEAIKQDAPEQPGRADEAIANQVEKALKDLEEAVAAAATATGKEKRKADAAVERAKMRLNTLMARADAKRGAAEQQERMKKDSRKDAPDNRKADPAEAETAQPERKAEEKRPDPQPAREERARRDAIAAERDPKAEKADVELKEDESVAKKEDLTVEETTKDAEARAEARKLNLKDKDAARDLIRDLIGKESEVSKAEAQRESRLQPDFRSDARRDRTAGNREDIRQASAYLQRKLEGKAADEPTPAFFRRPESGDDRHRTHDGERRDDARDRDRVHAPRYYHEGRRYVRFDSRNSVPAILLAAAALERVLVQPAQRVDRYFADGDPGIRYANELPPQSYRGDDSVVVSYPVSKDSMISSNDIIFAQGSTRFADAHSYDMVMALADAIADPKLSNAKFVIEGHASAEGSYDENMRLSQRRAESIVRDLVREGIDPERLIPVGYGESEARYPADAAESLRSLDRNVMVFRTDAVR